MTTIEDWIKVYEEKFGKDCQAVKDLKKLQREKDSSELRKQKVI